MTIRYELNNQDFYEVNLYIGWSAPEKRWYRVWTTLQPLLIISAFVLYDVWDNGILAKPMVLKGVGLLMVTILILSIFFAPKIMRTVIWNNTAKHTNKNTHLLGETELEINDVGVSNKGNAISGVYEWNAFIKVRETANYIFLFVATDAVLPLKKDAFENKHQLEEVKTLIYNKIDAPTPTTP